MIYNMNKKRLQELAGININKEVLSEEGMYYNPRNNNYLYHYTNWSTMYNIIKSGYVLKNEGEYNGGKGDFLNNYTSFTRDRHLNWGWVCIVLDRDKLSQKYKITPYDDYIINKKVKKRSESEEKIKGPIYIKDSIVKVGFLIDKYYRRVWRKSRINKKYEENIKKIKTLEDYIKNPEPEEDIKKYEEDIKFFHNIVISVLKSLKSDNIPFSINNLYDIDKDFGTDDFSDSSDDYSQYIRNKNYLNF